MDANNAATGDLSRDRIGPWKGISPVVLLGLAVTGIFVLTVLAVTWLNVSGRRELHARVEADATRQLTSTLARGVEMALVSGDVSGLRRIVSETGAEANLTTCRVLLPDGRVVADLEPQSITPGQLPEKWIGSTGTPTETVDGPRIRLQRPVDIPGRGSVVLEVAATSAQALGPELHAQIAEITIAGLGLVVVLVVYRYVVRRMRPVRAVYQALTEMASGQTSTQALTVCADFGLQAEAWNNLLGEREQFQQQASLQTAREAMTARTGDSTELTVACDALPQGLVLVDVDMRVRYANGASAVLLGVSRDQVASGHLPDLVTDERILDAARTAAGGPTHKRTIVELQRGETPGAGVLRFVVRPVRRGDQGSAMVIIEDITQQRVAEDSRKAFLAQAAHELRTPLTNIRLCVEEALDEADTNGTEVVREFDVINTESRRLERVVTDILSISEIEAGSFQLKRDDVRLEELFKQLQTEYEPQARSGDVSMTFDLPPKLPTLRGDRDKIALTLHNLIGNALKYTPSTGRVTVTVEVTDRFVSVDVSDTGIGISEEDRPRIFERFYRARDRRLDQIKGSGLGLSLARDVAHLHGGDITVQSELNKGTTFTLTLPLLEEAA